MRHFLLNIFLVLSYSNYYASAYVYYNLSKIDITKDDVGEPLILTKYIDEGKFDEGQEKARVNHPALKEMESYAGYITVNKTFNSNTFFWFFPSKSNPKKDPVIIWYIGGPGLTCLVTIFYHNGPLALASDNILHSRNFSLINNHSMIYIDNPIGTGFSFTDNEKGYARNQSDIAKDSIAFLVQFFTLFYQYRNNDFYIGGDSYGGKYVISVADAIRVFNDRREFHINLQGIIMGNGLIDLKYQADHGEFLYNVGILDKKGEEEMIKHERKYSLQEDYLAAQTGFTFYSNILVSDNTYDTQYFVWNDSPNFRKYVHVGNQQFNSSSNAVRKYFETVLDFPVTKSLENLLCNDYRVLVYNGQLDIMFPYVSSLNMYEQLNWPGRQAYLEAERNKFWVDGELAGYVKIAGNFYEALVRNAGHVTFIEQPKLSSTLVTRFTHYQPI